MKNQFLTVLTVMFISAVSQAQETAKVLFIGNSYTYVNDLPSMLSSIATSFGDQVTHDSQTPGGTTFQGHTQNAATWNKINSQIWDFVVLQAQSQEPSFPDSQVNSSTIPYAMQLADSVYANNFCTEVMMYMTWGRKNGDPQWAPISTFDGMNDRLRSAYLRMADSVQGSVSPVGSAWKYVRENYPSIELYNADESHPSVAGTYLAACTFYASIFRKTPVGSSFISSLSPADAANLQAAAALTVLDSLDFFNLRPISEHTQANFSFVSNDPEIQFINESTKAQTYSWDFGDGNTSNSENPIHTFNSNNTFTVQLTAESPCDTDVKTIQINISLSDLDEVLPEGIKLLSFATGIYSVKTELEISNVQLVAMNGKQLKVDTVSNNSINVNLTSFEKGIYLLMFTAGNELNTIRLTNF
jgi:PKD repeat protein